MEEIAIYDNFQSGGFKTDAQHVFQSHRLKIPYLPWMGLFKE